VSTAAGIEIPCRGSAVRRRLRGRAVEIASSLLLSVQ